MAETIEGLKERRAWLLKQVELTDRAIEKLLLQKGARPPRPTPQELPGLPPAPASPPRKPSVNEENHAEFQQSRRTRLERLGVEFVPDEPNTPAFINVTLKRIREACVTDDEMFAVFDAFLSEDWAARCTPPYPLRALAPEKTWRRLIAARRAFASTGAH